MTIEQAREMARNTIQGLSHRISCLNEIEEIVVKAALMRYYLDPKQEYSSAIETILLGREEEAGME